MIPEPMGDTYLSGYRLMWILVLFDLPVGSSRERKAATRFRQHLLDRGFSMAQFSVYFRLVSGKEVVEREMRALEAAVPNRGTIQALTITDKQYETMRTWRGKEAKQQKNPDQLLLF